MNSGGIYELWHMAWEWEIEVEYYSEVEHHLQIEMARLWWNIQEMSVMAQVTDD